MTGRFSQVGLGRGLNLGRFGEIGWISFGFLISTPSSNINSTPKSLQISFEFLFPNSNNNTPAPVMVCDMDHQVQTKVFFSENYLHIQMFELKFQFNFF